MYLDPRRAICFTVAEPWRLIRSARSEILEETGIRSGTSMRSPPSETSRHVAGAYLGSPCSSSQEIPTAPRYGMRWYRRMSLLDRCSSLVSPIGCRGRMLYSRDQYKLLASALLKR